jgi:microfibrillar-associated protein 1
MPAWVEAEEEEEGFAGARRSSAGAARGPSRWEEAKEKRGGEGGGEEEEYVPTRPALREDRRLLRVEHAKRAGREGRGRGREVFEAEVLEEEVGGGRERGRLDGDQGEAEGEEGSGDLREGTEKEEEPVEEEEEEEEEAIARRRAAIRERLKSLRVEEEAATAAAREEEEEAEEEEEEEDSEYEEESEESEEEGAGGLFALARPVFIPKGKRELDRDREREEEEEVEKERKAAAARESRRRETRLMVAEEVRKEAEGAVGSGGAMEGYGSDAGAPDDSDRPEEDALEFENWRLRELARMKREMEARQAREKDKAEVARRRGMTEAERDAEDRRLGVGMYAKQGGKGEKAKWKFMQKYYHKGAFYMDEESVARPDDVRRRAADEATGEDKFNRAALPSVMQVKNFGRAGQTKYTHLLDQDTTRAEVRRGDTHIEERSDMQMKSSRRAYPRRAYPRRAYPHLAIYMSTEAQN